MIVHVLVFANKTITTGEGGMGCLKKNADKARILINQGYQAQSTIMNMLVQILNGKMTLLE